jgi:hypothetical protein
VFDSSSPLTRRAFLRAAATGLALPVLARGQSVPARETLYNGIVLPQPWPPVRAHLTRDPQRPPYLASPPEIINIDIGRQLFVDEFLIEESSLHRAFHRATYYPGNPILTPERDWERRDPYADTAGTPHSPSAMVFSDGVFFDPADKVFKMWYMGGYQQHTALAISRDGLAWERPPLDVVRGTNIVSKQGRDSNTVWLDLEARDPRERFKMAGYDLALKALRLHASADGVHWREVGVTGPCGDRSTCFRNPFRKRWGFSLRADGDGLNRFRRYFETPDFASAKWTADAPVPWTSADTLDPERPDFRTKPELYNLDAVAYESVMLGLFTIYRGEKTDREKPNDLCVAFSRDGFYWSRPWREPFIGVSERQGDWNWGNVQSAGGVCVIAGDQLYFYVSGRQGVPGTGAPGVCSTGVAMLRRDGFASITDTWPTGSARPIGGAPSTLVTRPLRFSGQHLFVNAVADGELRVEVLDRAGKVIAPFSLANCVPVIGDSTRHAVQWKGRAALDGLAGEVVRFRFVLSRARVFAFWVSPSARGNSRGYLAAGGPGLSRPDDV